ncbi:MAG: flagellar motor protein MotD [Betaproteobacteria bacterium]|nr:flagellar motor protein MotD [Betaproteobacteria bacterium]
MARRKRPEEHENLERWMVSYADFVTLLLAFFIVMYAISSINEGKYRVLTDSITHAFQQLPSSNKLVNLNTPQTELLQGAGLPLGKGKTQENPVERERMKRMTKQVLEGVQPLVDSGEVRVSLSPKGILVEINASLLFKSGEAALQPQATDTLATVAQQLKGTQNLIQVEGHTDNVPIKSPAFPSNWELSSARAGSVVRLFTEMGIDAERMMAIGYSDNRPVETNTTLDGRTRNRRVNILILNETGAVEKELVVR